MTSSLALNIFADVHAVEPVSQTMTLNQLAGFLTPSEPPLVTREERKRNPLFSLNIYKKDTLRAKENVESMTGVVFDFDNKEAFVPLETIITRLTEKKIAHLWYTTHSHTLERPKWRLILPFATPLSVTEWPAFYQQAWILIGSPLGVDHAACKDVAHMWYPPYRNEDQPYQAASSLHLHVIESLDIALYLTSEEQAQVKALTQERSQKETVLSFPETQASQPSAFTIGQAMSAVGFIKVESAPYEHWLTIGMALHYQFRGSEIAFKVWDLWSSQSPHYNREGLLKKWQSFADNKEKPVGIGTLIHMAKKEGYDPAQKVKTTNIAAQFLDIADFLAMTLPPLEMLVDPIIPRRGLVMMYAPRGIGKTYLSLSIAYIAAGGKSMLDGKWKADRENRVLFIDGEMPGGSLQHRLKGIVRSVGPLSRAGLFEILTPDIQTAGMPDLSKVEGQRVIDKHLEGANLLVLDNLSCLFRSGSENEAESWKVAQEWLLDLRRRGISVLLIHHANKNGSQRGTSKKEDLLDTVISLRRPEDYDPEEGARFEVHYEKARGFYGQDAKPFEVQLKEENDKYFWMVKDLEDDETEMIAELYKQGLSVRNISKEVGLHRSKVERKLKKIKPQTGAN